MVMSDITLSIPDETLVALKISPEQLGGEIRLAAAGKLAGMPRTLFLSRLADYGVDTFRLTEQELQQEHRLGYAGT